MKPIVLLLGVLALLVAPVFAKEAYVSLEHYATKAEAIAICTVEKDQGDGTVSASITEVLKGTLGKTEIIRGETGHCVLQGPVSHFMKSGHKYLVFLFKDNKVGRLGGILEIEKEQTLLITYIHGFTGTDFDKDTRTHTLPVIEAKRQIKVLLQNPGK